MPYIVTTTRPDLISTDQSKYRDDAGTLRYSRDGSEVFPGATGVRDARGQVSRRAVATLDEARDEAREIVGTLGSFAEIDAAPDWQIDALDTITELPESGGTIGPLPDGTVIEVERIKWMWLALEAGITPKRAAIMGEAEIIDAYNAAQGEVE